MHDSIVYFLFVSFDQLNISINIILKVGVINRSFFSQLGQSLSLELMMFKQIGQLLETHHFIDVVAFGFDWGKSWQLAKDASGSGSALTKHAQDLPLEDDQDQDAKGNCRENDHVVLA